MKYIHYGHKEFDISKFKQVENQLGMPKPTGGLWASSVDAEYGWKEWHSDNDIGAKFDEYFEFSLKEDAKVLTITNISQLENLPQIKNPLSFSLWVYLDFEKLAEKYDAIEVVISKDNRLYQQLYTWDCDSILIINPDVIETDK